MVDAITAADAGENSGFLVEPIRRDQDVDRLSNDLLSFVSEQALGAAIPAPDYAVEILADDGIVGGLHNGGELPGRLLRTPAFGDVAHQAQKPTSALLELADASLHREGGAVFAPMSSLEGDRSPGDDALL